jgi:hypothetical protein
VSQYERHRTVCADDKDPHTHVHMNARMSQSVPGRFRAHAHLYVTVRVVLSKHKTEDRQGKGQRASVGSLEVVLIGSLVQVATVGSTTRRPWEGRRRAVPVRRIFRVLCAGACQLHLSFILAQ